MDSIKDLAAARLTSIQHESQHDQLAQIQHELDRLYHGQVRAARIEARSAQLFVHMESSALATVVRYNQVPILASIRHICDPPIQRLVIQIRTS